MLSIPRYPVHPFLSVSWPINTQCSQCIWASPSLRIVVYVKPPVRLLSRFWVKQIAVEKCLLFFSNAWCWSSHSSSHARMATFDRATVHSISHIEDVGVVNPCLLTTSVCLSEPSRAPGRLRARSVSASEVEVTWKPLAWSNNRRRILGYEVRPTHAHTMDKQERSTGNRSVTGGGTSLADKDKPAFPFFFFLCV